MAIASGSRLGRFEIRSQLGAGGMGEVYLAQDTRLDRLVAIKVLAPAVAAVEDRMRRFVQEAKAISSLNHPNIITIHEIDEIDSRYFIATEYVDGVTVRERLQAGPVMLREVLDIATQAAAALAAAHAAGIVHRDVKPENIMVRRDGVVKVLDFGLAKLTASVGGTDPASADATMPTRAAAMTEAGVVMGTARYMSPEQARGRAVDARTDIFSLGVVLYEMVTRHVPYEGATTVEVVASMAAGKEPEPLGRYSKEVTPELERITSKAIRRNPDERYQTMKDLLLDLRRLQQPSPAVVGHRRSQRRLRYALGGALIAALLAAASGYWFAGRSARSGALDSIAVLPFENRTRDEAMDYLSDGITESLIGSLSQLPRVKVIARNSVFSYKNRAVTAAQVARELNVRAILTGRVLMQGGTLDVRAELTDTATDAQLWGDHYTRQAVDVVAVQDDIARQVIDALRVRLTGEEREHVSRRYTDNAEAYQQYLQGRHVLNGASEEAFGRAMPFFDRAIALDPQYALAYSARGETFFYMGDLSLPMNEAVARAKENAAKALALDAGLTDARVLLANIKFQYDWKFDEGERDFRKVVDENPNHPEAHHQFMYLLALTGRTDEAVKEIRRAQQLDPINPSIVVDMSLPYGVGRRFDEAVTQARKALDLFPSFFLTHMALGASLVGNGDIDAGIAELEKARNLEASPLVLGNLGYAYARGGRKSDARKVLTDLAEASRTRYVAAYASAVIHAALEEHNEAFALLEKAYQERSWWLLWLKADVKVDALRSDPRFDDLMRRIGLAP